MLGIMSTGMAAPNGIAINNNNNSSPGGKHIQWWWLSLLGKHKHTRELESLRRAPSTFCVLMHVGLCASTPSPNQDSDRSEV